MDDGSLTISRPRFCYVVLAHTDAPAALRLARRVRELSPGAEVLLRHAQAPDFLTAEDAAGVGVRLLHSDIAVSWGLWSLTHAAVEALEHARRTTDADRFVLLSGQDHPVRDLTAWEDELVASGAEASFLHFVPRDQDWRFRWRIVQMPAVLDAVPHRVKWFLERVWRRTGSPVLAPVLRFYRLGTAGTNWGAALRRPGLVGHCPPVPVVCGSFWLTCSAPALDRLLTRHREDRAVSDFFAPTLVPDEHYLQSLLAADPLTPVRDSPTTHQHVPPGDWNALLVDLDILADAVASGAAFTRKVGGPGAAEVVARADELVDAAVAARLVGAASTGRDADRPTAAVD